MYRHKDFAPKSWCHGLSCLPLYYLSSTSQPKSLFSTLFNTTYLDRTASKTLQHAARGLPYHGQTNKNVCLALATHLKSTCSKAVSALVVGLHRGQVGIKYYSNKAKCFKFKRLR